MFQLTLQSVSKHSGSCPLTALSSPPPASSPQPREPPKLKVEEICCCYFHPDSTFKGASVQGKRLRAGRCLGEAAGGPTALGSAKTLHPEQPPETPERSQGFSHTVFA